MRVLLIFLILSIAPSLASAAYLNQAEVLRYEQDQNGAARLILRFTGNAGEEIVDRPYYLTPSSSFVGIRNWVASTVSELNMARTAGKAPQVAPGTVINGLAASASTPSAKSAWSTKVTIYAQSCNQSFTGAVATACSTLKADIEATYQAGFLDAN